MLHESAGTEICVISDGETGSAEGDGSNPPTPTLEAAEACNFGERLCAKSAKDWAQIQQQDLTARTIITFLEQGTTVLQKEEEKALDGGIDKKECRALLRQGELLELGNGSKLLVRRLTPAPMESEDRNPGVFERYLGDEPRRTYVPMMLRPWVMDQTHKEAVHLGEKVTLALLQRLYWWIGMEQSVKFWIRRCYSCQAKKSDRYTVRWPLVSLPLPSRPGQMVAFDFLGPPQKN